MVPLAYEFRSLGEVVSRVAEAFPSNCVPETDGHIFRPSEDMSLLEGTPRETESANGFGSQHNS